MKRYMFTLGALFVLLILSPTNKNSILAEETSKQEYYFVDLDGDGFNDNTYDFENNRFLEKDNLSQKEIESKTKKNSKGFVSFDFGLNSDVSLSLSKSERFKLVKFSARTLDNCRGESDSDFSGDFGGISGSGQAGGCVGGVCIAN